MVKGHGVEGAVSVMCAVLRCTAQVCLLTAVLCGSPAIVFPFLMSAVGGLLLWILWRGKNQRIRADAG